MSTNAYSSGPCLWQLGSFLKPEDLMLELMEGMEVPSWTYRAALMALSLLYLHGHGLEVSRRPVGRGGWLIISATREQENTRTLFHERSGPCFALVSPR